MRKAKYIVGAIKDGEIVKRVTSSPQAGEIDYGEIVPASPQKPEARKQGYVRSGLHVEMQKFGEKPKPAQTSLFEMLDKETQELAVKHNVEMVGIDATLAQNKALHAIQKLFTATNYEGNTKGKDIKKSNPFEFKGYLPSLRMTLPEFLDAYGVTKKKTSRGKEEYNRNEREEAVQALKDLHKNNYLFYYERVYFKDGKELRDAIRTIRPLIQITEGFKGLTETEASAVKGGGRVDEKLTHIAIEPCPILIDQINTYFVLKPANLYQEVKLLYGKVSKHFYTFLEWLIVQAEQKRRAGTGSSVEIYLETLSYTLKKSYLLDTRQYPRLKRDLLSYFEKAKGLGYLSSYEVEKTDKGELAVLSLNEEKYYKVKKIAEERAKEEASQ